MFILQSRGLFLLFFVSIQTFLAKEDEEIEFRYSVILSEPLESTLDWDYHPNDPTKLILQWNITLLNQFSGILAFSNYDLNTDRLDVIIFGRDEKVYNGYTDENSVLFLPKNGIELNSKVISSVRVDAKRKKYSIRIIRPLDTCEKEKRNYIIDRGTIHLLTGAMKSDDFNAIKKGGFIDMDVKRFDLTLQRVQLLKSQVSRELFV